jgi:hypothetical protein
VRFLTSEVPLYDSGDAGADLGGEEGRGAVAPFPQQERKFFMNDLLVQIHFVIEMIWWTGFAPSEFEFPFSRLLYVYLPSDFP